MSASQEIIQHWILNTAIEFPRKLSDFVPFVECESLNVKEVPGATPSDYAAAFLALVDNGTIQAYPIEIERGKAQPAWIVLLWRRSWSSGFNFLE